MGRGATLYRDVWVDRPQGLLALFRLWDMVSLGNEQSVRVMAMLLGAIMVVAGVEIGRRLHSRRGVLAAAFVAAASSAALIAGFLANGELLSGTFSALAVAVGATVIVGRLSIRWFVVAGAFGALAVSIKQSGVDGFGAVFAWLSLAAVFVSLVVSGDATSWGSSRSSVASSRWPRRSSSTGPSPDGVGGATRSAAIEWIRAAL